MTTFNIKTVNINIGADEQKQAAREALRKHLTRPFNPDTDGTPIEIDDDDRKLPKSVRRALGNLKHCAMG